MIFNNPMPINQMSSILQILYNPRKVNPFLRKLCNAQRIILLSTNKSSKRELKQIWEVCPEFSSHKYLCLLPGQWLDKHICEIWCPRFQALITRIYKVKLSLLFHLSTWKFQIQIKAEIRWSHRLVIVTSQNISLNKEFNFHQFKDPPRSRVMKTENLKNLLSISSIRL